jgi:hypothetical protein
MSHYSRNGHIERVTEENAEEFIRWIERSMDSMEIDDEIVARSKALLTYG